MLKPDSASVVAYLRCDSSFRVIVTQLSIANGKRIRAEFQVEKLTVENGELKAENGVLKSRLNDAETVFKPPNVESLTVLTINCKEDSLMQEIELRERTIRELSETKQTEIVLQEKPLHWWQKALMWAGAVCIVGLIGAIIKN